MRERGVVVVGPDRVRSARVRPEGREWIEERAVADPGRLAEAVDLVLSNRELWRCRHLRFEVEFPLIQRRSLPDLPPVSDSELRQLVCGDVARFFRISDRDLVVDAAWTETDDGRVVRAVAMETDVVRLLEASAARVGLRRITVAPAGEEGLSLVLESPEQRASRRRRSVLTTTIAVLAALVSWGAAAAIHLADLRGDRTVLEAELARVEAPLRSIQVIRRELESFRPVIESLEVTTSDAGWASRLLVVLTDALPAGDFVERVELRDDGSGRLVVLGTDPIAVVRRLHRAGRPDASLRGEPLDLAAEFEGRRRFEIGLEAP